MTSQDTPHRRYNPLTDEYVLVSPHRMKRPWQGKQEPPQLDEKPPYDPKCYLCPGNSRAGGQQNASYDTTYVFTNDFAALLPHPDPIEAPAEPLLQAEAVRGTCRVICFSPRHDLTLPEMELSTIRNVVDVWAQQTEELGQEYAWVQVFENKGALMGASNPHPHGQIWAQDVLPNEVRKEDDNQRQFFTERGTVMLVDYAELEARLGQRVIVENDHWLAVVPYWAMWPFETLLLPRRHVLRIPDLTDEERNALSDVLKRLLTRYDNLFETSFPYSMGWHGAPFNGQANTHWQLHAHFYPPLLRSASVRKWMVGYEMMGESQRDLTAEQAAARLQALSETHYKQAAKES